MEQNFPLESFRSNKLSLALGEGKTRVPGEKPLGAEYRTNKLNPHMTPDPGIEPGSHWSESECFHHCAMPAADMCLFSRFCRKILYLKLVLRPTSACSLKSLN